jgi:hypothetical protein
LLSEGASGQCDVRDGEQAQEDVARGRARGLRGPLFFHRRLRCLVVIDLKLGEFTHADAGQMHLYLNYAREHWTMPDENPPVGLILCAKKDHAVAKYALEGLRNKVLAAEYRTALPTERHERLRALGLLHEVLRVDVEAVVVVVTQARVVELPDLIEQRRRTTLPLGELVKPHHVAHKDTELRPRHDIDRRLGDHQQAAPAHAPQRDPELLEVDPGATHVLGPPP